jgi:protein gp37
MGRTTNIEWTDHTFNPWWGCSKLTPGCDHCYAKEHDRRFGDGNHWGIGAEPRLFSDRHWQEPLRWNAAARRDGVRRKVFCGSMCDVLQHGGLLVDARERLFALIDETPDLDWLLLSKRLENAPDLLPASWFEGAWPSHVWAGVSVENQGCAYRLELLVSLPAPVRFVSCEPLLSELDVQAWLPGTHQSTCDMDDDCSCGARHPMEAIHWVIVGAESGMRARPPDPAWVLWLRDQCRQRETPFFFKGWGKWLPASHAERRDEELRLQTAMLPRGGTTEAYGHRYHAVGKKHSGALLGGLEYKQFPKGPQA